MTKKPALPKVAAKAKAPIMIDSDDDSGSDACGYFPVLTGVVYELPAPKPATAPSKTKPKQTTLDGFSAHSKKAATSKPSSDQSDDDVEIKAPAKPAPAKKPAASKPKPKPKAKIVEISEAEEVSEPESDFEAITKPKKATVAGAAKKKSKKDESDFGESS